MKRRIILAGGSGFLGAALARTFLASGDEVVVLLDVGDDFDGVLVGVVGMVGVVDGHGDLLDAVEVAGELGDLLLGVLPDRRRDLDIPAHDVDAHASPLGCIRNQDSAAWARSPAIGS